MRIIALSDLHGWWNEVDIPDGDVLVIAGDFTRYGEVAEVAQFNEWLGDLAHGHKLIIAGNHDRCLERAGTREIALTYLTNAQYLEDSAVVIDGAMFYGSPWTPAYYDWAFMLPRGGHELREKWSAIPTDTNVLITHGPPYGVLDTARDMEKSGCELLAQRVEELRLDAHIFGHIHEGHGALPPHYNVSICTIDYLPTNPATVIDIETDDRLSHLRIDNTVAM